MDDETDRFLSTVAEVLQGRTRHARDPFLWLTPCDGAEQERLDRLGSQAADRLRGIFPDLSTLVPGGGWPVVVLRGVDEQLAYEGLFSGEGATILHGGCWRSHPVGHVALPLTALDMPDAALAHELVHAILDPRDVPLWMQEGIATGVEERLGNRMSPLADPTQWRNTVAWWREHGLDCFWDGTGFADPAVSDRAYALAQVLAAPWFSADGTVAAIASGDWTDEDATLLSILGRDRAALERGILHPPAPRGWLARLFHALVVDQDR
jgi:hypothetical protein